MGRRRRQPSSPSPAGEHPLEDDDLLREILLRLPPQPPYLLRASLVATRWQHIATEPKFLRRFRIHHRKPPLLGDFSYEYGRLSFRSTLDLPYRIPPGHFSLQLQVHGRDPWRLVDCRPGSGLLTNHGIGRDPVTGDRSLLSVPTEFEDMHTAAVLCAAGEQGHAHGACHSSPFKVVVVDSYEHDNEAVAFTSVYCSETGVWSDLLSTPLPYRGITVVNAGTLVGNTLHWLLKMHSGISRWEWVDPALALDPALVASGPT
uniref:F-box domain-containing protein n=1 Tax=Aegilops tauschii TaxID=37682 RepID=N1QS78_AEGTA